MSSYVQGSDLPDYPINWFDGNGNLIDFTGYTFQVKVAPVNSSTASFTKTTGITGAATEPNITIAWAATGELNSLDPGSYSVQIRATRNSDGKERYNPQPITINIRKVIS